MSISDFEDQVLKYVWRALVIAGLLTALGGIFRPAQSPDASVRQRASNTAGNARSNASPAMHQVR